MTMLWIVSDIPQSRTRLKKLPEVKYSFKYEYSYFSLDCEIKIIPIANKTSPPGMNLPINKLVNSIPAPIIQDITPNLNFHLFCITIFILSKTLHLQFCHF